MAKKKTGQPKPNIIRREELGRTIPTRPIDRKPPKTQKEI